ncbi:UNKNOWN [Stylonychia lemnae]|uniref:Uncharacterized protein n=1 Tax=Stylonychia lemnae TaxID=5949 RepID=A0A078ACY6_STYLE|nr:UNKNOWN [Stylonychia lemnae]|eukprot:CDW79721.1 UNKNOWN [Stylonychia lemnae]
MKSKAMDTFSLNQRMDMEKLQDCPKGCKIKAKYYCTNPTPCNGFRYFCESCAQKELSEGGHPHKVTSIIKVIRDCMNIEDAKKNEVEKLYVKFCENEHEHSKFIEFFEKGLIILPEYDRRKKLSDQIQSVRQLNDDFAKYFSSLEELCLDYKAQEIIDKIENEGVQFEEIYQELVQLKQFDQDLIWKYYSDVIQSDFSDQTLMSEFTEQNWNMYHNLCRRAQNEKIASLGQGASGIDRIGQLEAKFDKILQENENMKSENQQLKYTVSLLENQIALLNGTLKQIKIQLQEKNQVRQSRAGQRQNEISSLAET